MMFVIETKRDGKHRTIWTAPYKCRFCADNSAIRMRELWSEWSVTVRPTSAEEIKNARSCDYSAGGKTSAVPKWMFK